MSHQPNKRFKQEIPSSSKPAFPIKSEAGASKSDENPEITEINTKVEEFKTTLKNLKDQKSRLSTTRNDNRKKLHLLSNKIENLSKNNQELISNNKKVEYEIRQADFDCQHWENEVLNCRDILENDKLVCRERMNFMQSSNTGQSEINIYNKVDDNFPGFGNSNLDKRQERREYLIPENFLKSSDPKNLQNLINKIEKHVKTLVKVYNTPDNDSAYESERDSGRESTRDDDSECPSYKYDFSDLFKTFTNNIEYYKEQKIIQELPNQPDYEGELKELKQKVDQLDLNKKNLTKQCEEKETALEQIHIPKRDKVSNELNELYDKTDYLKRERIPLLEGEKEAMEKRLKNARNRLEKLKEQNIKVEAKEESKHDDTDEDQDEDQDQNQEQDYPILPVIEQKDLRRQLLNKLEIKWQLEIDKNYKKFENQLYLLGQAQYISNLSKNMKNDIEDRVSKLATESVSGSSGITSRTRSSNLLVPQGKYEFASKANEGLKINAPYWKRKKEVIDSIFDEYEKKINEV